MDHHTKLKNVKMEYEEEGGGCPHENET